MPEPYDTQDGGFSPEELEAINGPEGEGSEGEPEGEPSPEPKANQDRGAQDREDAREAKILAREAANEARETRLQLLQALQYQQQAPQNTQAAPEVDPDAEEFVKRIGPALNKFLQPYQNEIARLNSKLAPMEIKSVGDAAFQYVVQNVPDLQDLSGDLMAYINGRPDAALILADPNRVVDCAEIVRTRRESGKTTGKEEAKKDARSRGRSETPTIVQKSDTRDWGKASDADLAAEMKRQGFF
jgi:hypothetical protein